MSADVLRRAAALMRERASAATPGPWHSLGQWLAHDVDRCTCYGGSLPEGHEGGCGIEQIATLAAPDAKHIASWHPAVALAVADWLDNAADDLDMQAPDGDLRKQWDMRVHIAGDKALAVARAYLNESA